VPGNPAKADAVVALIVPGIGNSGPGHWQTAWEQQHPDWQRVRQRDWDRPIRDEWVRALDDTIGRLSVPPVLIAHSMGCLLVAHWAHRSSAPVRGAFMVAVPDPEGSLFPPTAQGFQSVPAGRLRFPSLVVASRDDPFGSIAYARQRAAGWGSGFVEIGAAGHINADSGLDDWPAGLKLFDGWLKSL
jgi:predicted alpha/beta hydrolase family esterase